MSSLNIPNRERTRTVESTGSLQQQASGTIRERANTADSAKSFNETSDSNTLEAPLASPPRSWRSKKVRRRGTVEWIQKLKVPKRLSRSDTSDMYWIAGLDRVVYGNSSCAESVRVAGVKPPRYLWYMLSGAMCDVIQFSMDVLLHVFFAIQDASLCWALGFFMSIVFRHTSHRYLVFGDYVGGYWSSLARMYAGYSVIIVLSTLFNMVMTKVADVSHYIAWILTLLWTGIANYFILKKIWSFGGSGSKGTT